LPDRFDEYNCVAPRTGIAVHRRHCRLES
jgi:hypothetical protein